MSKLKEVEWEGVKGWQWEDGPIFVQVDGRRLAIDYGRALQLIVDFEAIADAGQKRHRCQQHIKELEALKRSQS